MAWGTGVAGRWHLVWIAALMVSFALAGASEARANALSGDCANGANLTDTACQNHGATDIYYGSEAQWENRRLSILQNTYAPSYGHINNTMWLYTGMDVSGNETQWVEMGLWNGHSPWCLSCTNTYTLYWGEVDYWGTFHGHAVSYPSADSSIHDYLIFRNSNGQWDVYRDSGYITTSQYQGNSVAYEAQVGLEVARPTNGDISWAHSDTFHNDMLDVYTKANGSWQYWWYQDHHNDQPCGSYPTGQCMNGSEHGPTEWDVNKP